MEGPVWEADVHTLRAKKLFEKPLPGWHGKGAYTGQGRLVVANNGEVSAISDLDRKKVETPLEPKSPEHMGVLGQWLDGKWSIVERRQFTDVTGPGGIEGAKRDSDSLWSIGWDRRSAMLELLDAGQWRRFRLPKASATYDHRGGWYTEWPRIREVGKNRALMDAHGMFYRFPLGFRSGATGGIEPISSHLRYVPDFCDWNGRLVLAGDDTSIMQNPLAGKSQSNLWFGHVEDLAAFGPRAGWGGPWLRDAIKAGEPSDPFLFDGFDERVAHLVNHGPRDVTFTLEIDAEGDDHWKPLQTIAVPKHGYAYRIFPADLHGAWIRATSDTATDATLVFWYTGAGHAPAEGRRLFASLADITDEAPPRAAIIRPASHDRDLQVAVLGPAAMAGDATKGVTITTSNPAGDLARFTGAYREVDERLKFIGPQESAASDEKDEAAIRAEKDAIKKMLQLAALPAKPEFTVDAASVIVSDSKEHRYRLPKSHEKYDQPFEFGWPRSKRECISERFLLNIHGTFYLVGRESGLAVIRPVATHDKQIADYCTWRGLMVLSGARHDAKPDGHYFGDEAIGLWFGHIDDLWKFGKPIGHGGPWKDTAVDAGEVSDPYLMAGYDKKKLTLSHDAGHPVKFTIEIDLTGAQDWQPYATLDVAAGQPATHVFPDGFSAQWLRARCGDKCQATAWLDYE